MVYDVPSKLSSVYVAVHAHQNLHDITKTLLVWADALVGPTGAIIVLLELGVQQFDGIASGLRMRINRVRGGLDMDPYKRTTSSVHGDDLVEHAKELTRLGQEVAQLRTELS